MHNAILRSILRSKQYFRQCATGTGPKNVFIQSTTRIFTPYGGVIMAILYTNYLIKNEPNGFKQYFVRPLTFLLGLPFSWLPFCILEEGKDLDQQVYFKSKSSNINESTDSESVK